MPSMRNRWWSESILLLTGALAGAGCYHTPLDMSEYAQGPAPLRMASPAKQAEACCYEDSLTGGQVFKMYCGYCHNAPPLAERPFSNYKNVAAHMRVRANLTGKEYAKLMEFLRRWHDVPPPTAPVNTSPKRLLYSQPIPELRKQPAAAPKASEITPEIPDRLAGIQPTEASQPLPAPVGLVQETAGPPVKLVSIDGDVDSKGQRTVAVLWKTADHTPEFSISLSYAASQTGPWIPIAGPMANTGRHDWNVQDLLPPHFVVRIEATDPSGNVYSDQSPELPGVFGPAQGAVTRR